MQTAHKTLLQKQNSICLKPIQPAGWVLTQCPSRRREPQEQVTGRPDRALLFFMLSPAGHSLFLRLAVSASHLSPGGTPWKWGYSFCLSQGKATVPPVLALTVSWAPCFTGVFLSVTEEALQLNSLTAPEIKQVTPDFLPLSWFVAGKPVPWPWQRTWGILAEFSLFCQALTPGLPSEECHCALGA